MENSGFGVLALQPLTKHYNLIAMKIIMVIAVFAGIIYAIIRFIQGIVAKFSARNLVKRVIEDPSYAAEILDSLDIMYGAIPFENYLSIFSKLNQIPDNLKLEEYLIRKTVKVDENRFLCITNCTAVDYGLSATGKIDDVKHYLYIEFGLVLNRQKSQCEFYSGIYADSSEKSIKNKFKSLIEDYLKSSNG